MSDTLMSDTLMSDTLQTTLVLNALTMAWHTVNRPLACYTIWIGVANYLYGVEIKPDLQRAVVQIQVSVHMSEISNEFSASPP